MAVSRKIIILLLLSLLLSPVMAADRYPFADAQQRQRFNQLLLQFRCVVCQNEDLASSGASLADDLRQQVYQMVKEGKSNQVIIDYMVNRYGQFVLFKPPLQSNTMLLWFGPFLLLLIGAAVLYWVVKRHRQSC